MRTTEAIAEAALRAGLTQFFGTPIAPQTELVEYLSRRLPEAGGAFLIAPDEATAVAMAFGAAAGGGRVMTSSSGPGFARMQEGLSHLAASEVPMLVVDVCRAGPGFGNILPSQADYFVATRGGGNGDYRTIALAPSSAQEAVDLTYEAFDLAEEHRSPVVMLVDAMVGQMMEPVELPARKKGPVRKRWMVGDRGDRKANVITSTYWTSGSLDAHNYQLFQKASGLIDRVHRYEEHLCRDADVVLVAFGIMGRVAKTAIEKARKRGLKMGLFRPISLWPFPGETLAQAVKKARSVLVLELSAGQMLHDVKLALGDKKRVFFYGRTGGEVPSPFEVMHEAVKLLS
ncbi:MAG: 3-methyl-2-oxobutanoate dehydrogenase subunit VorB [Candidatus Riflebacteria bacterium]|nr:3-methyl-2-oxobutanoate dehydrogenase subunit VorB [Candidatus Riflebacteria bacterium]